MAPTPLEIKTKALGRLVKEESLYQQELKDQEKVVSELKAANGDEYEIKKQIEVFEDTKQMIPEIRTKIKESLESLESFIESYTGVEDLTASKENIELARNLLN